MKSQENSNRREANGLREFLTVVFKHKIRIMVLFLAVVVTVTTASFLITPVYMAESSLLVKIGREYLNRPEVGNNAPVMSLSQEEITNSEIQILNNRDLIEKVITSLQLKNIYPEFLEDSSGNVKPLDQAIVKFQKSLRVGGVRKSNVIRVSFQHTDPQIAAKALNLLIELFREKHLQVFSDPKSSFLETQMVTYDQKLRESENRMQDFKQKTGVFSLAEQRSLLLKQRGDLDAALKNTENTIFEMQKRIAILKRQISQLSSSPKRYTNTERDKIIVDAKSRLLALQLNEQELLKKYTEKNRLVVSARKEIQTVKDFLKEQEADINSTVKTGNPVFQSVEIELFKTEAELNAQKGKAIALTQQLSEVNGNLRSLDYSEKNMQKLQREQAINEKNFQIYSEKAEEARITDDMNRLKMANISVIQRAAVPSEPAKPKMALNIILGVIFGIVGSVGFAFLSESSSQSFTTPEQVEHRLGLPVLTVIAQHEG